MEPAAAVPVVLGLRNHFSRISLLMEAEEVRLQRPRCQALPFPLIQIAPVTALFLSE
jgi:hypothetical protein